MRGLSLLLQAVQQATSSAGGVLQCRRLCVGWVAACQACCCGCLNTGIVRQPTAKDALGLYSCACPGCRHIFLYSVPPVGLAFTAGSGAADLCGGVANRSVQQCVEWAGNLFLGKYTATCAMWAWPPATAMWAWPPATAMWAWPPATAMWAWPPATAMWAWPPATARNRQRVVAASVRRSLKCFKAAASMCAGPHLHC
jgi:hypothetical protein